MYGFWNTDIHQGLVMVGHRRFEDRKDEAVLVIGS
jgi:hypothetical protein